MIQQLSDEQIKSMNAQMVIWTRKALKGKYGIYVYNLLLQLKNWTEALERDKV